MKHVLNPDTLVVQSFATQTVAGHDANDTHNGCVSDLSFCGVCPTDTGARA